MCIFRPDGEKKAYVRLAPDYDALDIANKVDFSCTFILNFNASWSTLFDSKRILMLLLY